MTWNEIRKCEYYATEDYSKKSCRGFISSNNMFRNHVDESVQSNLEFHFESYSIVFFYLHFS